MKKYALSIVLLFAACQTLTPTESALLTTSVNLADVAFVAAAGVYAGPAAATAAQVALSSIGKLAQSYLGQEFPTWLAIPTVQNTAIGTAIAGQFSQKGNISQTDVNDIYAAAAIANALTPAKTTSLPRRIYVALQFWRK